MTYQPLIPTSRSRERAVILREARRLARTVDVNGESPWFWNSWDRGRGLCGDTTRACLQRLGRRLAQEAFALYVQFDVQPTGIHARQPASATLVPRKVVPNGWCDVSFLNGTRVDYNRLRPFLSLYGHDPDEGHYCDHWVMVIRDFVVDLTPRQFRADLPFPLVEDVSGLIAPLRAP